MTLEELKAHAYDCISNIEMWQRELQATNAEITKTVEQKKQEITAPTIK